MSVPLVFSQNLPIYGKATTKTKNSFLNLPRVSKKGLTFGFQDERAYGIGWKYQPDSSDVKETADEYPAVFCWEIDHLNLGKAASPDSFLFDEMWKFIQKAYVMGGVNTISWQLNKLLNNSKTSWDEADAKIFKLFADHKVLKCYE